VVAYGWKKPAITRKTFKKWDKELYFVYVLKNHSGRFYIGSSAKPDQRLAAHNSGKVRSTKKHRPWQRIVLEEHPDRQEAESREKYLKSGWGRQWLKKHIG
jgi:putative endonuclease